jgi:hypothetical protein
VPVADPARVAELGDEPSDLGPGPAGDPLQVAPYQTLVGLGEAQVAEAAQLGSDPVVGGGPGRGLEAEGLGPGEEGTDLVQILEPLGIEHDDHPPMIPDSRPPTGTGPVFRLISRWNHAPRSGSCLVGRGYIHPDPSRTRKLLLQRSEINRLIGAVERKGYTLVPLSLYWKRGKAKLEIGLAKGKKEYDKRAVDKERDWQRERGRILKNA